MRHALALVSIVLVAVASTLTTRPVAAADPPGAPGGEPRLCPRLHLVSALGDIGSFYAEDVTVSGTLAYVSGYDGLSIVDIADPRRPRLRGTVTVPVGTDVAVSGGGTASSGRIAVAGGFAYVASYDDIKVYDVRDPAQPRFLARHSSDWGYRALQARDGRLYAAAYRYTDATLSATRGGLVVLDTTNPLRLRLAAALEIDELAYAMAIDGTTAVLDGPSGLAVIDLTAPLRPRLVRRLQRLPIGDAEEESYDARSLAIAQGWVVAGTQVYGPTGLWLQFGAFQLAGEDSEPAWTRRLGTYNSVTPWIEGSTLVVPTNERISVFDVTTGARLGAAIGRVTDAQRMVPAPGGLAVTIGYQERLQVLRLRTDTPCAATFLAPAPTAALRPPGARAYLPLVAVAAARGCLVDCDPPPPLAQEGGAWGEMLLRAPYAYVAHGPRVDVLDLGDPARPVLAGRSDPLPDLVQSLALDGNRAIVLDGTNRLTVLDLGNPRSPRTLGSLPLDGDDALGLAARDGIAYVGAASGLWVVALGDGTAPRVLRWLPAAPEDVKNGDIRSGSGRGGAPVLLSQHLVTFTTFDDGRRALSLLDVSDPTAPRFVEIHALPESLATRVVAHADHLYLATVDDGAYTLRTYALRGGRLVATSASPVTPVFTLALNGGQLYLADISDRSIRRYDLSDPDRPVWRASESRGGGYAVALAGDGDLLFARRSDDSFDTLRRDGEDRIPRLGRYLAPGMANELVAAGGVAVLADNHRLWTLDPDSLAVRGSLPLTVYSNYEGGPTRLVPLGQRHVAATSYRGTEGGQIAIVDLGDVTRPQVVAELPLRTDAVSLATDGPLLIAVEQLTPNGEDDGSRLQVLDATDPGRPRLLGELRLPVCCAVAAGHGYAVVGGYYGAVVVDLRDPGAPRRVAETRAIESVGKVALDGPLAYLLARRDGLSGLHVLDLADVAQPRALGGQVAGSLALTLDPPLAFVATGSLGVDVLDITSAAAPRRLAELLAPGFANSVVTTGDRVLVTAESAGVWAYDRSQLQTLGTHWGPGD